MIGDRCSVLRRVERGRDLLDSRVECVETTDDVVDPAFELGIDHRGLGQLIDLRAEGEHGILVGRGRIGRECIDPRRELRKLVEELRRDGRLAATSSTVARTASTALVSASDEIRSLSSFTASCNGVKALCSARLARPRPFRQVMPRAPRCER